MTVVDIACALIREARAVNERRLLVIAGDRKRGYGALESVLSAIPVAITETTLVGPDDRLRCEQLPQTQAGQLLGTTRAVCLLDAHEKLEPNALGKVVGAVDGGGLLVLLTPPLAAWPDRRDGFDEALAIPPFSVDDVSGHFRRRLIELLRAHRGIAIYDCVRGRLECGTDGDGHNDGNGGRGSDSRSESDETPRDGLTHPPPVRPPPPLEYPTPTTHRFPAGVYEACWTQDQINAVEALEELAGDEPHAVVIEADRGRGKSSAAGLAAGALAAAGEDVLVTAPARRNADELFARSREFLEGETLIDTSSLEGEATKADQRPETAAEAETQFETEAGGSIQFCPPDVAIERVATGTPDVVLVDEAAALPVGHLESLLAADRIGFATTVHGYEGAGRGFSVRFRERLAASDHAVTQLTLREPIRYAAGDPLEVWAFRALLLDGRPAVEPLVANASVESVRYRKLTGRDLVADEHLLREAFGLLVLAHYRTEPNDLARLLDAPNLRVRALCHDGHVVSVALLAREGNLPAARRAAMYEGERIRGNMLPDILTSQLRDEAAGKPTGLRVMRIATHHAVRSRGLGSRLLTEIRQEFDGELDWLGTSFGATPELLSFWQDNGYSSVHLSTTRNAASGEHSVVMLTPTSPAGRRLCDRHATRFGRRLPAICSAPLSGLDPDVIRATVRSIGATPPLELTDHEWAVIVATAYGPGLIDTDPGPFRRLVVRYLADGESMLSDRHERLLVAGVLQGRPWADVADRLAYRSTGQCLRALCAALCPLVERYGNDAALALRDRFVD